MIKNCLYLTYDGLNDPLGQSQVVPYLKIISKKVLKLYVISFEKKKNFEKKVFISQNTFLIKLKFTDNFGKLGKIFDMFKLLFFSLKLVIKNKINIIHARSHLTAYICLLIKYFFKINYIFDYRGLWIEERFENKSWKKNIIYNFFFLIFKFLEKKALDKAYKIIILTYQFEKFLKLNFNLNNKIHVIPCVNNLFSYSDNNFLKKNFLKKKIGFSKNNIIFCYLGSVGGIYELEKVLDVFLFIKKKYYLSSFLILTNNLDKVQKIINKTKYFSLINKVKIFHVQWSELKKYLSIVDIGVNFIKNGFPRIAQSPTRTSEFLSMGIPIITNKNIGDLDNIVKKTNGGAIINNFKNKLLILNKIENLLYIDKNLLKIKSRNFFSMNIADNHYSEIYEIKK